MWRAFNSTWTPEDANKYGNECAKCNWRREKSQRKINGSQIFFHLVDFMGFMRLSIEQSINQCNLCKRQLAHETVPKQLKWIPLNSKI